MPTDDVMRWVADTVAEYGVAVLGVGDDDGRPGFSYTIGLTELGHPEVVVEGMPWESARVYCDEAHDLVRAGDPLVPGTVRALADADVPWVVVEAKDTRGLTAVEQRYGRVDAVQLVWGDSAGRVPWHPGHANPPDVQRFRGPLPAGALELAAPAGGPGPLPVEDPLADRSAVLVHPAVLAGGRGTSVWRTAGGTLLVTTDDEGRPSPTHPLLAVGREHLLETSPDLAVILARLPPASRATRGREGADWVLWPEGSA